MSFNVVMNVWELLDEMVRVVSVASFSSNTVMLPSALNDTNDSSNGIGVAWS